MDKAEKPSSGQYSEGDRQTDKSQREGPEAKTKVNVCSVGPEEEGREETWETIALGIADARLPHSHIPTAKLPSPQVPAHHCPDTAHLQPSSWPGQRRGSYCPLCPGDRDMKRVYAQAHTLCWSFIWELGRPSLKEEMAWHVLI